MVGIKGDSWQWDAGKQGLAAHTRLAERGPEADMDGTVAKAVLRRLCERWKR